jgi:hypothetical protein
LALKALCLVKHSALYFVIWYLFTKVLSLYPNPVQNNTAIARRKTIDNASRESAAVVTGTLKRATSFASL